MVYSWVYFYYTLHIVSATTVSQSKAVDERFHHGTVDNLTQNNRFAVGSQYSFFCK